MTGLTYRDKPLTDQQWRGTACLFCGITLRSDNAIDLGQRPIKRDGQWVSWFPRACRPHGARP